MNTFKCLNLQFLFTYQRLLNSFIKFHAHAFFKEIQTCNFIKNLLVVSCSMISLLVTAKMTS